MVVDINVGAEAVRNPLDPRDVARLGVAEHVRPAVEAEAGVGGNGVDGLWVGRNVQRASDLPIIYLTANDSADVAPGKGPAI